MIFLNKYPSIKLDSGIRIVNYSSPHTYRFHTGEELPACSDEVAQDTKLDEHHRKDKHHKGWYDIDINYSLNDIQQEELKTLAEFDEIDIILVPYPALRCLKAEFNCRYSHEQIEDLSHFIIEDEDSESCTYIFKRWQKVMFKARVCKLDNRVTKVIRSDEFCV